MFELEMIPAREGDCFLLHYGPDDRPILAVIDGGPKGIYKSRLKPRMEEIRGDGRLNVRFMMVSHVDADHISGVEDMLQELQEEVEDSGGSPRYVIHNLWHNSFDRVIGNLPDQLEAAIGSAFGAASLSGELPEGLNLQLDAQKILAGVKQGHTVRGLARALQLEVNSPFEELVMAVDDENDVIEVGGSLELRVVGPQRAQILALQQEHDDFIRDNDLQSDDPEAALAAFSDESVPNLSSIVVEARRDGRTILFTGDARGDKIVRGLEDAGLKQAGGSYHCDVLKVQHHGSDNNVELEFFEAVTADRYVVSGNGRHGNPERATFEMLFSARPRDGFELILAYPLEDIDERRKKEWDRKFERGKKDRPWDADRDGLVELFGQMKAAGHPFSLRVGDGERALSIDLTS